MSAPHSERIKLLMDMFERYARWEAKALLSVIAAFHGDPNGRHLLQTDEKECGACSFGATAAYAFAHAIVLEWAAMTSEPPPRGRFVVMNNPTGNLVDGAVYATTVHVRKDGSMTSWTSKEDEGSCVPAKP
jgi:hypothetical protein